MPDDFSVDELDEMSQAVGDLLAASHTVVGRLAQSSGQNANDMFAIGLLIRHGPLGAGDLAQRLSITTASATVLIDRLEASGLARRERDPADRRRVRVHETPMARELNLTLWLPVIRGVDAVCRDLRGAEREAALRLVRRVTAVINSDGRAPDGVPEPSAGGPAAP
ncbi:MarR family transcriptional regulator [Pseudonocardia sp. DR1-2]|uniref:MarR family winged helix-turn-helix transcriptional regulator n=1 Tax=Pseudonocardia sp. DR1-2 TaxID=2951168 RepID=UPI002044CB8D|nr:MarR family transcriptional regulator [Pseudonocardia sp. DR1-2]MCM3849668.1 MarR family transcriptional regulator [Pseudonocardia sp. DR1-2]